MLTPSTAIRSPPSLSEARTDAPTWPEIRRLRQEAGARRHQVRELQVERDQLRDRVERHDRAEVERLVGDRLLDAADIWTNGTDLEALRDEDGAIDSERVDEAIKSLVAAKPHYGPPATNFHGGARRPVKQPASFGEALKNRLTGR